MKPQVKLALAMIVKGTEDEGYRLAKCLMYVVEHVDGIFITVTHAKGEEPHPEPERTAKAYGAVVSHYEWADDFSAARNFNFSQVPEDYTHILWLDADDALRGAAKLKSTIEENPEADVLVIPYLYAFDEHRMPIVVHMKTQVIRRGVAEWVGRLHEDLKPNRSLKNVGVKGIERIHLSDQARHDENKERNLRIALVQKEKEPDDPRSYWNTGNALKALQRDEEAIGEFDKFLDMSNSDDEKYIARLRRAESFWALGKKQKAVDEGRYAIGTKPEFPDAYHLLGSLYYELRLFEKARDMYLMGLANLIKGPKPYHRILVYNPRDYDYTPLMNLAKTYFSLSAPTLALTCLEGCLKIYPKNEDVKALIKLMKKEVREFDAVMTEAKKLRRITDKRKLRAALDNVPKKFESHPAICHIRNINFVKETSSGRDIAVYCGFTEEEWNPDTVKEKGIGGSEEAVYWLSNLLADKGWNIEIYNNCGHKAKKYGKVWYKPFWSWNYRDKQDAVILWRSPIPLKFDINAPKVFLDLHDVIPDGELSPDRMARCAKVFVKSKFQRDLFPQVPEDKVVILPNGIDPSVFEQDIERDPKLVINTSAPNRGIAVLAEKIWPEVLKEVPDAKCLWAYGWTAFDAGFGDNTKVMEWKQELKKRLKEVGIQELGRVNHEEVARMYQRANVWAYPSGFGEIDCISLSKAMAGGCMPVTTDFAALGEKAGHGGIFLHSDLTAESWVKPYQHDFSIVDEGQIREVADHIIRLIKNPPPEDERTAMREWAKTTYGWERIVDEWNKHLTS